MNDNEALCVGGNLNGRIRKIDADYIEVPVFEQMDCYFGLDEPQPVPFKRQAYRLEVFRSGSRRFHFYVEQSISHDTVMERLISCYHRNAA